MEKAQTDFLPGQVVRTIYGETVTVDYQQGCQVFINGVANIWYHPSKLFPVPTDKHKQASAR